MRIALILAITGSGVQPAQLFSVLAFGGAYLSRVRTLARTSRAVPARRQASFWLGIAALAIAWFSPLDAAASDSLVAHTSVHMLIGQIAAFFIVLGLTAPLIQPLFKVPLFAKLRVLSHPLVALPFWLINLYLWHLPVLFDAALANDYLHVIEHGMFFIAGFNLWMALIGPMPQPRWFGNVAKLLYVVLAFFAMMILGNVLVWSGSVFYDSYNTTASHWGMTAVADQNVAGAVMMIIDSIFTLFLFAWLFMRWAREDIEAQELLEFGRERGVELSPERTARAAAAGTGEHLRRRVEKTDVS
ncbi:MAG: cytochrome c oxidase assembly protein [Thermoleophilaceae bacterium]|nr:cytochrome c oxidase assembly protein [Thermoleophilaceae bacterium]